MHTYLNICNEEFIFKEFFVCRGIVRVKIQIVREWKIIEVEIHKLFIQGAVRKSLSSYKI